MPGAVFEETDVVRFIHRIQLARGSIQITYLERNEVREAGKSYLQHVLTLTRASHPALIDAFEQEADRLLDGALQGWTDSTPALSIPNSATALRAALRIKPVIKPVLSPREAEVLTAIVGGETVDVMAHRLFISPSTAKSHIRRIYEKLGANNRASAVMAAIRLGIVAPQ